MIIVHNATLPLKSADADKVDVFGQIQRTGVFIALSRAAPLSGADKTVHGVPATHATECARPLWNGASNAAHTRPAASNRLPPHCR